MRKGTSAAIIVVLIGILSINRFVCEWLRKHLDKFIFVENVAKLSRSLKEQDRKAFRALRRNSRMDWSAGLSTPTARLRMNCDATRPDICTKSEFQLWATLLVQLETLDCGKVVTGDDFLLGDYSPGYFAWEIAGFRLLKPYIPVKGKLGLWEYPIGEELMI